MYITNGIAYAGEPVGGIEVSHARYVGERVLLVTFSTGKLACSTQVAFCLCRPLNRLRMRVYSRIFESSMAF